MSKPIQVPELKTLADYEAAEARRAQLVLETQEIAADMANRNKTDEAGRRVTGHEYHEWRSRAVYALTSKTKELAALKLAMKTYNRRADLLRAGEIGVDPTDPVQILARAYRLFRRLQADGVDYDPDELALLDVMRGFLGQNG